jgi:predicted enzyme related to lactoylglutathione lyase
MGTRTAYEPGTPSWVDLSSPDPDASKAFYGSLLGWTFEDQEGADYSMAMKGGVPVAGIMKQPPEQAAAGVPPLWASYVTVADCAATTAKVEPAGGSVMAPPMDVMDAGKMSVIVDPTGAVICTWQPGEHIGAGLVNEPGALCWNELMSPDVDAALEFYGKVFGWTGQTFPMDGFDYTELRLNDQGIAGAMAPPMEGIPANWGVYLGVDDADAATAAAEAAGATAVAPPMDGPPGRWSVISDPQGAMVSLIALSDPTP